MILRKQICRYVRPLSANLPYIVSSPMSSSRAPRLLPTDVLVEEERVPGYRPEFYYPANPGEILKNRYKILTKIGWGAASTVWLAEDLEGTPVQHVTLKITTSDPECTDTILHELEINKSLTRDPSLTGFAFVRAAIDDFIATGPTGAAHLCLVFEAMREPLSQFQHRLVGDVVPPQLLKVYVEFILQGLDYLHSECRIIHTDLKADNIMMSFEDPSVIEEYVGAQADHPMPRKPVSDRNIYLSHNNFGTLKSYWMLPKIADFGLAHRGDGEKPLRHPIQPPLYHAPEVLLGLPWSYSADIWNLGVLLFEILEDKELFVHLKSQNDVYSPRAHIAEMIALLGPPPQELIEQERLWRGVPWERSFPGINGTWCDTALEYYSGPFFDSKGYFTHPQLIPTKIKLDDCVACMVGEEKALFLSFVKRMLQWLPGDRGTARELLEDPWLRSGLSES